MSDPNSSLSPQEITRRRFMGWTVGLLSALLAVLAGVPILGAILSPALRPSQKEDWAPIGGLDQFPEGQFTAVDYQSAARDGWMESSAKQTVWVHRKDDQFLVFSAICSHAGCRVAWKAERNQFVCPCHGGIYDAEGRVVAGPPPRPLTRYLVKLEQGQVLVKPA